MLKLAVDLDGTLADWQGSVLSRMKRLWNISIPELKEWDTYKITKEAAKEQGIIFNIDEDEFYNKIYNKNFWFNIKPTEDFYELLKWLSKYCEIFIVSVPYEWETCPGEKKRWVEKYFKDIKYKFILISSSKHKGLLDVDLIIDDSPKVADSFKDKDTMVFIHERPWNKDYLEKNKNVDGLIKINSLQDVVNKFKEYMNEQQI